MGGPADPYLGHARTRDLQQVIIVEPAHLFRVRCGSRRLCELVKPLLLIGAALLFVLLPRRCHQIFLVLLDDFGCQSSCDTMPWIEIQLA